MQIMEKIQIQILNGKIYKKIPNPKINIASPINFDKDTPLPLRNIKSPTIVNYYHYIQKKIKCHSFYALIKWH